MPVEVVSIPGDGERWGEPVVLPFSGTSSDQSPALFNGGRWRPPVSLGPSVNSPADDRDPTVGSDGALYFWSTPAGRPGYSDLYRAWLDGDPVHDATLNGDTLNPPLWESSLVVVPCSEYVIFGADNRPDRLGAADLVRQLAYLRRIQPPNQPRPGG